MNDPIQDANTMNQPITFQANLESSGVIYIYKQ